MPEYRYELKIPKSRIAVLIGRSGEVKRQLEEATDTKIRISSEEGDVIVSGEDGLGLYTVREIIMAVARGFNPELAKLLLKGDYAFEQISIKDYAKTPNHFIRIKGRIIGSGGKSRKLIEELSKTHMSVFGKTVGIIGRSENVAVARKAIESLLSGSPHNSVYRWLEKRRKELKMKGAFEE